MAGHAARRQIEVLLQERLVQGAMIQEGDTPVEDPAAMLEEAAALLQEIETLVRRINHTNAHTDFEGATLTEDDVLSYARTHLANFKVPRSVVFVDAFPRNASGKILKRELS